MSKISINLLPVEFLAEEIKKAKFYRIQAMGAAIILLMVFLSTVVVALRILQSQNISRIQNALSQSEKRISDLKNNQASLLLLKNRLTTINQFLGTPSKQSQMYTLITGLLPQSLAINTISVDKGGEVLVLAIASESDSLDNLITSLTSIEDNQDKISQVSLDSINRGRDGVYRISLKIKPK